jgi:hypothetical protein
MERFLPEKELEKCGFQFELIKLSLIFMRYLQTNNIK